MRARFLPLFCLMTMLIHGCATPGRESYKIGLELEKQKRLEESLCMFEEAVSKEHGNNDYSTASARVRNCLAGMYIDKAKAFLEVRPLTFDQLQQALSPAENALKLDSGNKASIKLLEDIKLRMNDMIARAEVLHSAAALAAEAKEWKYAIDELNEIKAIYPSYPELAAKLAKTESDGVAYYLKEADSCKNNDDMAAAINILTLALEIEPANQNIAAMLAEAKAQHTSEYYLTKAVELARQNDWKKVVGLIEKARALHPDKDSIGRIEKLQQEASAYFLERAVHGFTEGNLYGSFENLMSSGYKAGTIYDQRTAEFTEQLTAALLEKAESFVNSGKLGNSLIWYEKAQQVSGEQRDVFLKIQNIKEKIRQRVVKKIAVMDFTSPSTNLDAGRVMTDNLLSYLTKNASGDVKIFARDVLGAILKEIELGQAGLYDIESAKKSGKLKGTDVFIFGSVLQFNVEKNVDEGLKMVNAVVGKKSTVNPAYQNWAVDHRKPSEEEQLKAPPQMLEEEVKEIVKYKVANHKKTANVSVSFRVIDVEEGEVVITKTLKNKKEVADTYSEGVEFANIPFKELKLPSDCELLEQVVETTIADLGYGVLSRFQNLQVIYANSAEKLKKKGDYENSIERYIDVIHVEEVENISTLFAENARKEIEQLLLAISTEKGTANKSRAARPQHGTEEKAASGDDPVGDNDEKGDKPMQPNLKEEGGADSRPAPAAAEKGVPAPAAETGGIGVTAVNPVPEATGKAR